MNWNDIDLHPERRKLRQFAAILGGVALLLAIFKARVWALVAAYGFLSVIVPQFAYPAYVALTIVTFPIGWIVSRVMLALLYYGVLTPIGLVQRLFRRDVLRIRRSNAESYWETVEPERDPASYLRQF